MCLLFIRVAANCGRWSRYAIIGYWRSANKTGSPTTSFGVQLRQANKNRVFRLFFKRFCQVFTPSTKQVNCSG